MNDLVPAIKAIYDPKCAFVIIFGCIGFYQLLVSIKEKKWPEAVLMVVGAVFSDLIQGEPPTGFRHRVAWNCVNLFFGCGLSFSALYFRLPILALGNKLFVKKFGLDSTENKPPQ